MFFKIAFLKNLANFTGSSHRLQTLGLQLYLGQVHSCELYEISKSTFFTE